MENVDFLQPPLYTQITYFNPDFIDTSHKLAIFYADGKLGNI